jgi:hypothetical protein
MTTEPEPSAPTAPEAPNEEVPNEVYAPKAREVPQAPIETSTTTDRSSVVVVRPGVFLTLVIASALGAGLVIYWLLRSMHI